MYCVHCGADGAASYCRKCGKPQTATTTIGATRSDERKSPIAQVVDRMDWYQTLDYDQLLECEEPRGRIIAASAKSKPGVTGEEVLAVFEAVVPSKISWSKLTYAIVPIADKLGIKTTNRSQAVWQIEAGRVLVAYLCALASKSLEVTDVEQEIDSCVLSAKIPLGIITNPGKVITTLESKSGWVRATLDVTISGQWYDWGKSKRLIEDILAGINADLADQCPRNTITYQRVA